MRTLTLTYYTYDYQEFQGENIFSFKDSLQIAAKQGKKLSITQIPDALKGKSAMVIGIDNPLKRSTIVSRWRKSLVWLLLSTQISRNTTRKLISALTKILLSLNL